MEDVPVEAWVGYKEKVADAEGGWALEQPAQARGHSTKPERAPDVFGHCS